MKTFLRLLQIMKAYTGWVVLSVLLGVATTASSIGLMGSSSYLITMAALQPSIAVLQVAIVGVRFFGIARGIF
ncbi:MAG: thiol reductant ABC exporter subunit CydC, partial [Anaerolineaceae bacterium]